MISGFCEKVELDPDPIPPRPPPPEKKNEKKEKNNEKEEELTPKPPETPPKPRGIDGDQRGEGHEQQAQQLREGQRERHLDFPIRCDPNTMELEVDRHLGDVFLKFVWRLFGSPVKF